MEGYLLGDHFKVVPLVAAMESANDEAMQPMITTQYSDLEKRSCPSTCDESVIQLELVAKRAG